MQISEIHIDGFGIFANKHITGLTTGINIIYGENEFGKSTLLEFIKRILFGFPRSSSNINPYPSLQGGVYGGKLICKLDDGKIFNIARTSGLYGGRLTLVTDTLELSGQDAVNNLLCHMTRTFYENVYAISLNEIQAIQSLQKEEVKSFIYGAGLGLGNVSINDIKNGLRAQAEAIYKPRGSVQKMSVIYNDIKKLEKQIHEIQKGLSYYDSLSKKRDALLIEVDQTERQICEFVTAQRSLENRHKLYTHYLELKNTDYELSLLNDVGYFPEDALEILKEMRMGVLDLEKRIDEEYKVELDLLTLKNEGLTFNEDLIKQESTVNSMHRLSEKYRSSLNDISLMQTERSKLAQRIKTEIRKMGDDWSEELIEDFKLTHFQNDKILSFKERLEKAKSKIDRIENKLEHHREMKSAKASESFIGPRIYRYAFYAFTIIGLIGIFTGFMGQFISQSNVQWSVVIFSGIVLILGLFFSFKISKKAFKEEIMDPLEKNYEKELNLARSEFDHVNKEWIHILRKDMSLDEDVSPEGVDDIVKIVKVIQADLFSLKEFDRRIEQIQKNIDEVRGLYNHVIPCLDISKLGQDISANIEIIIQQFNDEKGKKGEKEHIEARIKELTAKIKVLTEKKAAKEEEIRKYILSMGATNEEDLKRRYLAFVKRNKLNEKMGDTKRIIQSTVGIGEHYERFMESLSSGDPETIESELEEVTTRIESLKEERDRKNRSIGELSNKMEQLSSSQDLLISQNELEIKKQQLNDCSRDWLKSQIALFMLNKAISKYENTRQPEVIRAASNIFSIITNKRYSGVIIPVNRDELRIKDGYGNIKSIMEMSRGTKEQLYLAMRLGLIKEYEKRSESMPVIMDDILVNFDDKRNPLAIRTLMEFAKGRQVIILTCHRNILEKYLELGAREPVFHNGVRP